jgi:hypothetical protein
MLMLSVAREFSETPGPRAPEEGNFSGLQFLDRLLLPRYKEAVQQREELLVDFDGTEGYATSFLEAAFGGLARLFKPAEVLKILRFKCDDEPYLKPEVEKYIREAQNK